MFELDSKIYHKALHTNNNGLVMFYQPVMFLINMNRTGSDVFSIPGHPSSRIAVMCFLFACEKH